MPARYSVFWKRSRATETVNCRCAAQQSHRLEVSCGRTAAKVAHAIKARSQTIDPCAILSSLAVALDGTAARAVVEHRARRDLARKENRLDALPSAPDFRETHQKPGSKSPGSE